MYCQYCELERPSKERFCKTCGAALIERPEKVLSAEFAKQRFLLDNVERWKASGKLSAELVDELSADNRKQLEALSQALAVLRGEKLPEPPNPQAAPPKVETAPAPAPKPAEVVVAAASPALPVAATPLPAPVSPEKKTEPAEVHEPTTSAHEEAAAAATAAVAALAHSALPEPMDLPEPPPSPTQQIVESESTWPKFWRPLLSENVLWFIAAALLVAGSFYFVSWSKGSARQLLIAGLVSVYATGFWFIGRFFAKKKARLVPGRVLASISGAMAPMALFALHSLHEQSVGLWAVSSAVALFAMVLLVRGCASVFSDKSRDWFTIFAGLLMALFTAVPLFTDPLALELLDGLALIGLWVYAPTLAEAREDKGQAAFLGIGIGWLALCLFAWVHYQGIDAGFGWAQYAPLTALLVAVAMRAERSLLPQRDSPSWLALLLLICLIPAVIGAGVAEWPTYHRPGPSLGLTAAISTLLLVYGARSWRSRAFTILAVFVGWISFYTLTGFFKLEWLLAIAGGVRHLAGYGAAQKLPFNYGGLASLIYLAGVVVAYHFARKRDAGWAVASIRWSALILTGALILWAHVDKDGFANDLKPAIFTCSIICIGALLLSHWLVHERLAYVAAIVLTILGLDIGLFAHAGAAAVTIGLAASALVGLAIGLLVSSGRAQAFRDFAMVGFLCALLLVPFSGTGWPAFAAWGLTALAGLGAAFSLGSGLPAALGLVALGGALLFGADALKAPHDALHWIAFVVAFGYLAGSGLEKKKTEQVKRGAWFGWHLPLGADGFAMIRGPLAFAGMVLSWTALVLACVEPHHAEAALAVFALAQLWLARRQPSVVFLTFAILGFTSATVGVCIDFELKTLPGPTLAACALLCSLLAIAVDRSSPLQRLLRVPPRRAGITFAVHACTFAMVVGIFAVVARLDGKTVHAEIALPLALALAAAAFYALPRWNRWAGWLYPAALFATMAVAFIAPVGWITLVIAGGVLLTVALALTSQRKAAIGALVLGAPEPPLVKYLAVLGHLQAVAVMISGLAVDSNELAPRWMLAPAAAALAVFYALAPRLDGNAVWLTLFGIFAWATVALPLPAEFFALSLAAFAVILVALGALFEARARRSALVLALTGLGLGAAAVTSFVFQWPAPAHGAQIFALIALALALTPRVFRNAIWVALSAGSAALALLFAVPGADQPTSLLALALFLCVLALAVNRFPKLSQILFDLESPRGVSAALVYPATLFAGCAVGWCVTDRGFTVACNLPLSLSVGGLALVALLGFIAERKTLLMSLAVVAFVGAFATMNVRFELAFVLANVALNAVFLLAGLLSTNSGGRFGTRFLGLFSPPGAGAGLPANAVPAMVTTSCVLAYLGVLTLVGLSLNRFFALALFLDPAWAPWMTAAQLVTAAHQLRRRPKVDSWHAMLVATLAAIWLLGGPEMWPYLAGAAAIAFAALSGAATTARGRALLGLLLPRMDDDDLELLAKTLVGYSTATAILGCAITGLDARHIETPIALALAAAAFGVQAALHSSSGKVLFVLAVPAALHWTLAYLGIRFATGRPHEAILTYWAAAMGLAALASERIGAWRKAHSGGGTALVAAHLYAGIAALEWGCGLGLVQFTRLDLVLSFVAGSTLTLVWTLRARASGKSLPAWLAEAAFLTLYFSIRLQTDWIGPRGQKDESDAIGVLVLGFLFLGLNTAVKRAGLEAFKTPTRVAALLLPVLSALLLAHQASGFNAAVLFGVAIALTGLSALEGRGKMAGILAGLAYNLAICVLWLQQGIGGAGGIQYYVIPAGLTLVAAAWVWKDSLGPGWSARLRSVGALSIYVAAAWPALASIESTPYLLWAILLCVLGAIAGVLLRVRAYLYVGTACFVIVLVGNAVRFGIRNALLGAAFLTLLGLLLVTGLVVFSIKREELLTRYRKYRSLLAEWE